ncbi:MAG TPA: alkaline phosphatase family protein [Azospirillaceae bacterium]|nr:alkaline phosphatase family protein [Azospirillaceae bacterium]
MSHPVIAIGLDSAERTLVDKWLAEGRLPTLAKLRAEGMHAKLENFAVYSAELPWTTFLTGCAPQKTGYWTPIKYDPKTYTTTQTGAYSFDEVRPFYALGQDYRIAVFDMPHATLSDKVNGIQALAWGAHSPQSPTGSLPRGLMEELVAKYGEHPAFEKDNFEPWESHREQWLIDSMVTGIRRRADICCDLLKRDRWDLFLTMFGEPHSAGHALWHLSQPDHPLYRAPTPDRPDPLLLIQEEIDRAMARIIEAAPEGARVVVFSAHGMEANSMDVPSMFFLPELLYRMSFGKAAFARGEPGGPLPDPRTLVRRRHWASEIYARKEDWNPLRRLVRGKVRFDYSWQLERLIGSGEGPAHPNKAGGITFMPASWYANCWPRMKAFALPTFADGYVRINLKGREANGIVDPADYDRVCDEITAEIMAMTNPRNGRKVAKNVVRTRTRALDDDPRLPDADLVVEWESQPADVVEGPGIGRIGPVPYRRTGSHTSDGFVVAAGPGIGQGELPNGHGVDLAPTILQLMGAPAPNHLDGVSLFNRARDAAPNVRAFAE